MTIHWYDGIVPDMVPREEMPQVDEADIPALIHFAATRGVQADYVLCGPGELHVHQAVDELLVARMGLHSSLLLKPCLLSEEPYILDGNHRADAHRIVGTPVPAFRFRLPFAAAVQMMFHFPRTYSYAGGGHSKEEN